MSKESRSSRQRLSSLRLDILVYSATHLNFHLLMVTRACGFLQKEYVTRDGNGMPQSAVWLICVAWVVSLQCHCRSEVDISHQQYVVVRWLICLGCFYKVSQKDKVQSSLYKVSQEDKVQSSRGNGVCDFSCILDVCCAANMDKHFCNYIRINACYTVRESWRRGSAHDYVL